jgi:hypothetical protein
MPPLSITWYDGGLKPRVPDALPADTVFGNRGVLFVGDKGALMLPGGGERSTPRLYPAERDKEFVRPEPTLTRSKGHHREWLDAIKGGPAPGSNFTYGARLTEITLLGVAALRLRKPIDWDPATMAARGLPEAEAIFRESYRKWWELG